MPAKAIGLFAKKWATEQPKALKTLARDFEASLAFYEAQEQAERQDKVWQLTSYEQPVLWSACFENIAAVFDKPFCSILALACKLQLPNWLPIFPERKIH